MGGAEWTTGKVHVVANLRGDGLLLLHDAGDLRNRAVVVRAPPAGPSKLARVVEDASATGRRVSGVLARGLGEQREYFELEWRRARWIDLSGLGDRLAFGAIALTATAAVVVATVALATNHEKLGWPIAILVLFVAVSAALVAARREMKKLAP